MAAYYNEHDRFASAWLRELIKNGLIADGEVDERDIQQVTAADVRGFVQCHFFAGIGGWSYALRLAGWPDDRPVWTGSCPCQPYSSAGKQEGAVDARNLWPAWFRIIQERGPERVFGEQVANAAGHGWIDAVSTDMEAEDYAFGAAVLGAHSVGAQHVRQRIWWAAHAHQSQLRASWPHPHQTASTGLHQRSPSEARSLETWWAVQPEPCSVVYGFPNVVDLLRPFGNAIVPQVAAAFIGAYLDVTEGQRDMTPASLGERRR